MARSSVLLYCYYCFSSDSLTSMKTRIRCRRQTRATRCITAYVLQTNKVDAQRDQLATELSWQRYTSRRKSPILSYRTCIYSFNLPRLHLAPALGVTPFEFCRDFRQQIQSLGILWRRLRDPTFSRFSTTPTCDRWRDRRRDRHILIHLIQIVFRLKPPGRAVFVIQCFCSVDPSVYETVHRQQSLVSVYSEASTRGSSVQLVIPSPNAVFSHLICDSPFPNTDCGLLALRIK